MKVTITPKVGYVVKPRIEKCTGEPIYLLYDGEQFVLAGYPMTMDDYKDNMDGNECFYKCEVFKTQKGNTFIYCRDAEVDEDYLVKVEVKK